MALKPCRECKQEVSTAADKCPHCGVARPAGKISKLAIIAAAIAALVVIGALSSAGEEDSAPEASATASAAAPIQISAEELWRAYDANEVAADGAYKGKRLAITGAVAGIDKDLFGDVVVRLRTPNEFMDVMATLHDSQTGAAAALTKGAEVTVTCKGGGLTLGSPVLQGCRLHSR